MKTHVQQVRLDGTIESVYFHKPDSGFFIALLKTGNKSVRITGYSNAIPESGTQWQVEGQYVEHEKYGRQFKADKAVECTPVTTAGIVKMLCNIEGVGKVIAGRLAKKFGSDVFDIARNDPDALRKVKGASKRVADALHVYSDSRMSIIETETILAEMRLGPLERARAIKEFSVGFIRDALQNNPYKLTCIPRVTFSKIDEWVLRKGILSPDSPERSAAIIVEAVNLRTQWGDTYARKPDVREQIGKMRLINSPSFEAQRSGFKLAVDENMVVNFQDEDAIGVKSLVAAEEAIADILGGWMNRNATSGSIGNINPSTYKELTDEQKNAVMYAIENRVSIITGGPGTGKSFCTKAVIDAFGNDATKFIVAPTGKAACRATEITGLQASTIHRFIGKVQAQANDETPDGSGIHDIIIVDETSMVDVVIFSALLKVLSKNDRVRIVLVGDVDQLPSIGPGRVLGDMIDSGLIPCTRLTKIHRQGVKSRIVTNAKSINNGSEGFKLVTGDDFVMFQGGEAEGLRDRLVDYVVNTLPSEGFDPIKDVQVIVGQHKSPLGVKELNPLIRNRINPPNSSKREVKGTQGETIFREGDKVMVTENNYDLNVVNGDQGVISLIRFVEDKKKKRIDPVVVVSINGNDVTFEKDDVLKLILSYVITTHKCVAPETIVLTENGYQAICDIEEKGLIACPGRVVNTYSNKVVNQPMPGVRVNTKDGYSIRITLDHGMDVWRNGKWNRIEGRDIIDGDILRLQMGEPDVDFSNAILPGQPENMDVRSLEYEIPSFMSNDLAEFLGMMVADGTICDCGFRLVKRHLDDVDRFSYLCQELFGAKVIRNNMENCHGAEVNSVQIRTWLTLVGGMAPNDKFTPSCVMQSSIQIRRSFLRGLFLDGSVHAKDGFLDYIELCTCFERLCRETRTLLLADNIISGTTSGGCFKIMIYGEQAVRYAHLIGFHNEFKSNRLSLKSRKRNRYMIPINFDDIDEKILWRSKRNRDNARIRGRISRTTAYEMGLKDILQYHYVKVKEVVSCTFDSVCVTVPDGHRFIQNGFCGWNSQGSEYPVVVMACHNIMSWALQRALVYTGVTRGKKRVVVFGREEDMKTAASKPTPLRRTRLVRLLEESIIKK